MRIAVVGSGVSGNLAARILSAQHDVRVFESASHIGGHAQTVNVNAYGQSVAADVAFMVLNRRTYPNFCRMLDLLGVDVQPSDMSLSVRCQRTGLEYQGSSVNGLFAQRRNLFRPSFLRMLRDIVRFNDQAMRFCEAPDDSMLLGDFLRNLSVGSEFRDHYLVPMSAAIWSADPASLSHFPAKFILGFLRNHGFTAASRSSSVADDCGSFPELCFGADPTDSGSRLHRLPGPRSASRGRGSATDL